MVQQHFVLLLVTLNDIRYLKNIFYHLVTLSIPKVAKSGQKGPMFAKFEIKIVKNALCTNMELFLRLVLTLCI